ncbi:MAG: winged helix-turn-helix domain-containing protein, partial [Rhizonema sp. PD37]|nr:winged helix-turn-helix domain-containing protein [Rhizonema sp. PD37]
ISVYLFFPVTFRNPVNGYPTSNVVAAQIRLLRRKLASSGYQNPIETLHGIGYRLNLTNESK